MRRLLGGLVVVLLLSTVPAVTAAGSTEDYADHFEDGGYSGNDGSLDFDAPWTEFGESDGPNSGRVRVVGSGCSGKCLVLDGESLLNVGSFGAHRSADLSVFTSAELSFHLEIEPGTLLTDDLRVEVTDEGGLRVLEYGLNSSFDQTVTLAITPAVDATMTLRFVHPGGLGGLGLLDAGSAYIDDVVLTGRVVDPTTTTTTTAPTTTTTTKATTTSTAQTPGTTRPPTTTTTPSTTPTTRATTTTTPSLDTTAPADEGSETTTTTTTTTSTTTTTEPGPVAAASGGPPPPASFVGAELRDAGVGLIAGFQRGLAGDLELDGLDVLGADVTVDFSMVVELFEAARIWLGALALIMAVCLVAGMDRRRWRNLRRGLDLSIVTGDGVVAHTGGAQGAGWPEVEIPPA